MAKILELIKNEEVLNFQREIGAVPMNLMGDRLFPDQKTKNLKATYYQASGGKQIPTMAVAHAFDSEAKIGTRPTMEKISIEKFLVKEKINLSELEQEYRDNGVAEDNEIVDFIFNDFARLAQAVKYRYEVAKMELLSSGKITVKENKLNYTIDFGLPIPKQTADWKSADADILGNIQNMISLAKAKGQVINKCVTTTPVLMCMCKNKAIQTMIYSAAGVGTFTDLAKINILMQSMFGFTIEINDDVYKYDNGKTIETEFFIPRNKFILFSASANGAAGTCIWGTTPEERQQGIWTEKSSKQFITLTGWATQDPVVEWFKATGLAVPVMPNRDGHVVADVTTA